MAKLAKNRLIGNSKPENSSSLDTLAQLVTDPPEPPENGEDFKLNRGTRVDDKQSLQKRARRKYMSVGIALGLVDAQKQNSSSKLKKGYWNTYHCCNALFIMESGKVISKYCKRRWCLVCNSIRTAQLILRYKPTLDSWENKVMATVTKGPRCTGAELKDAIEEMQFKITQIRKIFNQRHKRGTSEKFVGLRKLECTYDPITNTYHPHYHFIFKSLTVAREFLELWLQKNPNAKRVAQDIRPADDNSVIEVFKYFTKVVSKSKDGERVVYADAMDVIYNAITGKRIFQNFGFKIGKVDFSEEEIAQIVDNLLDVAQWDQEVADWVIHDTGEMFSGYEPGEGMQQLVQEQIIVRPYFNSS